VRHAQALSNLDPAPDLPAEQLDHLTDLGQRQAEAVGRALRDQRVSGVLTSPASRARETAERIVAILGAGPGSPLPPLTLEPRLRPLSLGRRPDGIPLDWDDRIADWEEGRDPSPREGESMEQMAERVAALVASLAQDGLARSLVLVAHGEVLGAYLGRLRGTPPASRYPPGLANASITVVDVAKDGKATIRLTNRTPAEP
jgi:broad specificity phosphatase PhoE